MADFRTHITFGAVTGGLMATTAMVAGLVNPSQAAALTLAATVGGILPDIDLNNSKQSRYLFGGLGIFLGFVVLFKFSAVLSIAELWIIWLGTFLLFRLAIWRAFNDFTIHRGVFHSLLACLFYGLAATVMFYHFMGKSAFFSWTLGGFVAIGALVHLILDEFYSVDFAGNRVKRSFGTAVKLFSAASPTASLAMLALCIGLYFYTPSMQEYLDTFANVEYWDYLRHRLLPDGPWFDFDVATPSAKDLETAHQPGNNRLK